MNGSESNRELLVKIGTLKSLLVTRARGGKPSEDEYADVRGELLALPQIRDALPTFVLTYRTIQEFWNFIRPKFPSYDERTNFLEKEFAPLLTQLEPGTKFGSVTTVDRFRHQFPFGLPFGLNKPHIVVRPQSGSQVTMFEDEEEWGVIRDGVYPNLSFAGLQAILKGTPIVRSRLEDNLIKLSQTTSEISFFRHCVAEYQMFTGNVPVLIPQAWIQWHSKTKPDLRTAGSPYAADLYRVDFVAFWQNRRFAIMIDDIGHYAKKVVNRWDADEGQYSARLKEDRKLRKEGWDVFRVSNWEIRNAALLPEILADLREFLQF